MTNNTEETRFLHFYGQECEHCQKMEPLIKQLEKERNIKFEQYEVWHNKDNAKLMDEYDKNLCGGVPFFYNTHSQEWICGETSYERFKEWSES